MISLSNIFPVIQRLNLIRHRSRHQRSSIKKDVLKNLTKFTGKHLCQSLFHTIKLQPEACNFIKKILWHRCFPVNFVKFSRINFLRNTSCGCFWRQYFCETINDYSHTLALLENYPYSEFFWSAFSRIWTEYQETEYLSVFQSKYGKTRTRKTPNMDTFYAVSISDYNLYINYFSLYGKNVSNVNARISFWWVVSSPNLSEGAFKDLRMIKT